MGGQEARGSSSGSSQIPTRKKAKTKKRDPSTVGTIRVGERRGKGFYKQTGRKFTSFNEQYGPCHRDDWWPSQSTSSTPETTAALRELYRSWAWAVCVQNDGVPPKPFWFCEETHENALQLMRKLNGTHPTTLNKLYSMSFYLSAHAPAGFRASWLLSWNGKITVLPHCIPRTKPLPWEQDGWQSETIETPIVFPESLQPNRPGTWPPPSTNLDHPITVEARRLYHLWARYGIDNNESPSYRRFGKEIGMPVFHVSNIMRGRDPIGANRLIRMCHVISTTNKYGLRVSLLFSHDGSIEAVPVGASGAPLAALPTPTHVDPSKLESFGVEPFAAPARRVKEFSGRNISDDVLDQLEDFRWGDDERYETPELPARMRDIKPMPSEVKDARAVWLGYCHEHELDPKSGVPLFSSIQK